MRKLFWVLGVLAMASGGLSAQNGDHQLDSLMTRLYTVKGKERLATLNLLPELLMNDHPNQAKAYIQEAEVLARKYADEQALGTVLFNYGHYYIENGKLDSALDYHRAAYQIRLKLQGPESYVPQAQSLNAIGVVFDSNRRADSAATYYISAIGLAEKAKDEKVLSSVYSNIGTNRVDQEEFEEAIVYMRKGLAIDLKRQNEIGASTTMSNIGMAFQRLEQYDSSLHYHKQALETRQNLGKMLEVSRSLNNIGLVYGAMERRQEAAEYFLQSLAIKRTVGNASEIGRTLSNLGCNYNKMGRYAEAVQHLQEARRIGDTLALLPLRLSTNKGLAAAYQGMGKFEQALHYLQTADTIEAQIFDNERSAQSKALMLQFETADKEKRMQDLMTKNTMAALEATKMRQREYRLISILVVAVVLGLSVFLGFLFISNRNRKLSVLNRTLEDRNQEIATKNAEINAQAAILSAQNGQIMRYNTDLELIVEERTANLLRSNAELDTFLYQSSHALRGPLMRIQGLVSILRDENPSEQNELLFEKVEYTIRGTDRMLFKLMDAAEIHRHQLRATAVDLRKLLRDTVENINESMSYPPCEVRTDLPEKSLPIADHFLFETILRNLIENALHFRYPGRQHSVEVQADLGPDAFRLRVRDNGLGIPADQVPYLGQMFHRATPRSAGMGLGLYVVHIALARLGGKFQAQSEEGLWTEVVVELPLVERQSAAGKESMAAK